ncbi:MAG: hypothetical protein ACRDBG_15435 [Waterburya sp.]
MLSDKKPNLKSPTKHLQKGERYSDKQKIDAVKCWLITGNASATAAHLGIPLVTFNTWRYSQWWDDIVKELKTENNIKLSNRLRVIAEKAMSAVEDRLENGDWIYDQKTGDMRRKPMNGKDASKIASEMLDRQIKVEKLPQEDEKQEKILDRLEAIKQSFLSMSKPKIEVTDVIFGEEK